MEKEVNLGDGFFLHGASSNSCIAKTDNNDSRISEEIILGQIESFKFNDRFILVYRLVTDDARKFFEDRANWETQLDPKSQFWIIDKQTDSIYGPMTKNEYNLKRNKLMVPEDLRLKKYE